MIDSPGFECGHELSLKTHEIPVIRQALLSDRPCYQTGAVIRQSLWSDKCWIMSIWHNGCYQTVDVVRQSILPDGQYFQTGAVVRQAV